MHLTKQSYKESEKLTESPHFDHNDNHWRYEQLNKIKQYLQGNKVSILKTCTCIDILSHDINA